MITRLLTAISATLLVMLHSPTADAAVCDISPQGVNFGSYDALSNSDVDGVGNLSVRCDGEVSFNISLSSGSGNFAERRMVSGADSLAYNLYVDASRLSTWGDGTSGTNTVARTAASADLPIYGRMPARQNVPAGFYFDTIIVTIVY